MVRETAPCGVSLAGLPHLWKAGFLKPEARNLIRNGIQMQNLSEQAPEKEMTESTQHAELGSAEMSEPDPSAGQAAFGEAQAFEYTSSLAQKIFAVVVNLLVLGEVTIAMYFASQQPDSMTPIFFKVFFALLVPTLIGAYLVKRFINSRTIQ